MKNGDMPASPQNGAEQWDSSDYGGRGLSKREHFAAMAMQGMSNYCYSGGLNDIKRAALSSVAVADALLEELNK